MPARVQLIFASNWVQLDGGAHAPSERQLSAEIRCGRRIRLERGLWAGHAAIWVDWAPPHASALFPTNHRDPGGLAVALAAAVESSADASHWLLVLSHVPTPQAAQALDQRMRTLQDSTMVTWRAPSHDLLAAGFACELYSELIRLDSAHALDRLLRRYPCLNLGETPLPAPQGEHSPTVYR